MLMGVDLSFWNRHTYTPDMGQFQIHKLTEGSNIIDSDAKSWFANKPPSMPYGVYHFLTLAPPNQQAEYFVSTMRDLGIADGLIAFDNESYAFNDSPDGTFLREVITNVTDMIPCQPIVYTSQYGFMCYQRGKNWEWFKQNVSWWLADYNSGSWVDNYDNTRILLRQFTSTPSWDIDVFYGTFGGWQAIANATNL